MAAYLVLMQQVHDIDRYRNEYLPGLRPFLRKHGAEVLVAGFGAEPGEGEPPNSTVVLRFADAAAAWGLLSDPDYRARERDPFQHHVAGTGSGCARVHAGRVTAGLAAR
jgi:uncharacterized protein (DUF1330 family)